MWRERRKQPDMMEAGGGGGEGGTGQRWWPPAVLLSLTAEILAESPVVTVRVNRAQCCFPTSLPGNNKTLGVSFTRNSKVANLEFFHQPQSWIARSTVFQTIKLPRKSFLKSCKLLYIQQPASNSLGSMIERKLDPPERFP